MGIFDMEEGREQPNLDLEIKLISNVLTSGGSRNNRLIYRLVK